MRQAWSHEKLLHERAIALGLSIDPSSAATYNSHFQSYLSFCCLHSLPIDPTPDTLSFYTVFMCHHIKPNSVGSYLSGITSVLEPHFEHARRNRNHILVTRTLAGMKKLRGSGVQRKRALSSDDLAKLSHAYASSSSHDDLLFVAIAFTGFYALLRLGELVQHDTRALRDPRKAIRRLSVNITPDHYGFTLPMHKADRLWQGSKILIERRAPVIGVDPHAAFVRYLSSRDAKHPYNPHLWCREDGSIPTRSWFIRRLRQHFPSDIAGHSLRQGGATALALAGRSPEFIQALGRWASDTWKIYIQRNPVILQAFLSGRSAFDRAPMP